MKRINKDILKEVEEDIVNSWTKEVKLQYEIGSLEEKLKNARTKIRKLNKIIDALTK
tara:strand:- start:345 stop:515 length:171 start_codon:yes stop_codon:yes gene_type:complete